LKEHEVGLVSEEIDNVAVKFDHGRLVFFA
jgi:hypothetical protein